MDFKISRSYVRPLANGAYFILRTVNKQPMHVATITKVDGMFRIMELGDVSPSEARLRPIVEYVEGLQFNARLGAAVNETPLLQEAKNMFGTEDVVDDLNKRATTRRNRQEKSNGRTISVHGAPLTR